MKRLLEIITENEKLSSSRIMMMLFGLAGIVDWQHAIWTKGEWTPSYEVIVLMLGSMGWKTLGKKYEKTL